MRALTILLLLFVSLNTAPVGAQNQADRTTASEITEDQAIAAFDQFRQNPVDNLKLAPVFLEYIQTAANAHVVLNSNIVFWMYGDLAPQVKAVLYAAFMGGSMNAQIRGAGVEDDATAGISAAIDAYQALKLEENDLEIPAFEKLSESRAQGALQDVVARLTRGEPLQ